MIVPVVVLSLIFLLVGFMVNEKNAPYMLSGYNRLSKEEQQDFDLPSFIRYFRCFHVFLSLSTAGCCWLLYFFEFYQWSKILLVLYPLLAYAFLIWKSNKFYKSQRNKH